MSNTRRMATRQATSNAASTDDSNSTLVDPSLAVGAVPDSSTASTQTPSPSHSMAPGDPLHTVQYISDNAWPSSLILDRSKSNWEDWSLRLTLIVDERGFTDWLHGSYPLPNATTDPKGNRVWLVNGCSLKAFMLRHVSRADYKAVSHLQTSSSVFNALRKRHEDLGVHNQVMLLDKALKIRFRPGIPLSQTADEIDALHARIIASGPLDDDKLRAVLLLNGLGEFYPQLQSTIQATSSSPNFGTETILRSIHQEEDLIRHREEQGAHASSTALAAQSQPRTRVICSHCKRHGHLVEFCIQPGGKMEGCSLDDAKAAQRAAAGRSTRPGTQSSSAHVATSQSSLAAMSQSAPPADDAVESVVVNGKTYYAGPSLLLPPATLPELPSYPTLYPKRMPAT